MAALEVTTMRLKNGGVILKRLNAGKNSEGEPTAKHARGLRKRRVFWSNTHQRNDIFPAELGTPSPAVAQGKGKKNG